MFGKILSMAVIHCHGVDSKDFLQGQLTCNLKLLKSNINKNSKLAAHCSVKGRAISLFRLIYHNDQSFYLIVPKTLMDITLSNLKKYAAFSQTQLENITDNILLVGCDSNAESIEGFNNFETKNADNQIVTTKLCDNLLGLFSKTQNNLTDISQAWKLSNIKSGIPAVYPETSDKLIPQRLNLFELGGLSFKKGCYLGQEVLSRLYYRGTVKYSMVLGKISGPIGIIPGEKISDNNNKHIGTVVDQVTTGSNTYLLFEKLIDTDPNYLYVQEHPIILQTLPYEK